MAAGALKTPQREIAFASACDMVVADVVVSQKEERYLESLAGSLAVGEPVVELLVHATVMRNRGAESK